MIRSIEVVDYHTEGEPLRIVTSGIGPIPGATLLERSDHLAARERELIGFVLREPRGHAAMCGAILTEPSAAEAHAGVLFIEPLGPVHMCGHGAMAVAAMLVETGVVAPAAPVAEVVLETPAGLVRCRVGMSGGRPESVTIRNVPAFSVGLDMRIEVAGLGPVSFDLAYGGHFYAIVPASS
ncbi:MAG TPA: proline racemase family protein, partial [Candidatus Methylomirabilis sp.]|nr:proline racemase family protein [Candidatus Methylomirabilis sp.]